MHAVDVKDRKGMRSGFTTGANAAAAAKAATRALLTGTLLREVTSILPNGTAVTFVLHRCELHEGYAECSSIKDGGDDPDCTHGAEIIAQVRLSSHPGVRISGGVGVALVTKPGLGLEVGTSAINPVPRQNIREMVLAELDGSPFPGADVVISVPDGEERAKKTLNARLGLIGGISILGTTGVVLPYSTAAFIASVVQAIALAAFQKCEDLVFTTGGRSENYAMKLLPHLPEATFIQVGDYIGIGIRNAMRQGMKTVHLVGMMGKFTKMADGRMMTHASASAVNVLMLSEILAELGAPEAVVTEAATANTARHVLELCQQHGIEGLYDTLCKKVAEVCHRFARGTLNFRITMVDFDGTNLGFYGLAADKGAADPSGDL
jgi:cobalt-precorrin-5B (C1)-methyltransferase